MVSPSCTSPYGPCQTWRIPEARAGYGVWPTRKGKELVQQKSCTNELMMKENKAHIPIFWRIACCWHFLGGVAHQPIGHDAPWAHCGWSTKPLCTTCPLSSPNNP